MGMAWKSLMNLIRNDNRFYEDSDENGEPKPAGWQFLQADEGGIEDGESDDGDEDYNANEEEEEEEDQNSDEEMHGDDGADDEAIDWDSMEALAAKKETANHGGDP